MPSQDIYITAIAKDSDIWVGTQEQRRTSKHMQYALAASQEALDDAGWHPESEHDKEMTVNIILFYSILFLQTNHKRTGSLSGFRHWKFRRNIQH